MMLHFVILAILFVGSTAKNSSPKSTKVSDTTVICLLKGYEDCYKAISNLTANFFEPSSLLNTSVIANCMKVQQPVALNCLNDTITRCGVVNASSMVNKLKMASQHVANLVHNICKNGTIEQRNYFSYAMPCYTSNMGPSIKCIHDKKPTSKKSNKKDFCKANAETMKCIINEAQKQKNCTSGAVDFLKSIGKTYFEYSDIACNSASITFAATWFINLSLAILFIMWK